MVGFSKKSGAIHRNFRIIFALFFLFSGGQATILFSGVQATVLTEINKLRPSCEFQKIEVTGFNAPILNSFINKYLQKFCEKAHIEVPGVCLYFNSKDCENYNFYWDGHYILLGSALLEILFSEQANEQINDQINEQKFEKYFSALLAHEFSHFKLNHKPESILKQEIEADTFAATLIDTPNDLVCAHIFGYLVFQMAQFFKHKGLDESKISPLIASVMSTYVDISPDFGRFTQCSSWLAVDSLLFEALMKTNLESNTDSLAGELALKLDDVSDESNCGTHPSPKQLSSLCEKVRIEL